MPRVTLSRHRLFCLTLPALCLLLLPLFTGCSKDLGKPIGNSPPETGVFVEGPLDTVSYAVKLYWWGQDRDGQVLGFYYRWTCSDPAADLDTSWVFTAAKSKNFILPVPNSFAVQTFWVKAVDNSGEEDPTPAIQEFPVRNAMPSVVLQASALPDTTLPAVTFRWTGSDPDGNNTLAYYVAWLDGKEDNPLIIAGSDTTLGPDYLDTYGPRTFYLKAVDESQGASGTVSHSWHVIAPVGNVLLVDDVPPSVPGSSTTDAFYRGLLDSLIPSQQYTVFNLASQGSFRSPAEVSLILPLFTRVVWYGDTRSSVSGALAMGEVGISRFLDAGGNMYLEGVAVLGNNGSLSNSFAGRYLGVDSLRTRYISPSVPASTNFDLTIGWLIRGNTSLGLDSLVVGGILAGCEIVCPSSVAQGGVFYLPPGTFAGQTADYYLGVLAKARGEARGDTTICLTFPVRRCNGLGNARQEVAKLLTMLGIGP
ncbi:MAG: hypothetical protein V2A71_02805 [Candidatus Eisenbacteria bacterium]